MFNYVNQNEKLYISPHIYAYIQNGDVYIKINGKEKKISDLSFEDKISMFEDWVNGWFFNILKVFANLNEINFSGFIILTSSLPYVEMMGQIEQGRSSNRQSRTTFVEKFNKIFRAYKYEDKIIFSKTCLSFEEFENTNEKKEISEKIYDKVRNGLMHNLMVKSGVKYSFKYPFTFEIEKSSIYSIKYIIKINPKRLIADLKEDFNEFIYKLKNSPKEDDIRNKFEKMFPRLQGKLDTLKRELSGVER